ISEVVLTHHHEDHTGMAYWFGEREVPIYMHPKGIELCEKKAKLPIYRQVFGESDHLLKLNPYQTSFVHLNILGKQFTLQDMQMIILPYITEKKAGCSVETYL